MTRRIFFHPERCLLCLSCVLSCQLNSLGATDPRRLPPGKPLKRISPVFSRGTPWAWKCQHCSQAPCVEACISGSIRRREDGKGIEHRPETCVGCGSCLLACPFSVPTLEGEGGRMSKCDLCPGEEIPACVKTCQSRALVFQEISKLSREKKKRTSFMPGGAMNPVDQGSQEYPPCGYGLLGLCCSDCLRGPCRISPFEKTQALCGADSDLLVAGNLCRLAAGDFVRVLKSFTQAVGEFKKKSKAPSKALTESLARKYGIPGKELIPFLKKETTGLLDPLADQSSLIFSSLFSKKVFSRDHSGKRCGPFPTELFGLLNWKDPQEADPEALLRRCLDSAASMLIVEELTRDILSLVSKTEQEKGGWANPSNLPNSVKPVVLSLVETERLRSTEMQRLATALKEIPGVLSISLRGTEGLIRLCHSLREKWHRPIPELPVVVLVESPDILPILAPLALGLATVSDPSLPIRGSKKAEDFFYSGLSKVTGNFYLPVTDETALSRLSRVLGRKL